MKTKANVLLTGLGVISLFSVACSPSPQAGTSPSSSTVKSYPKETCLVTGKKLGTMGEPVAIVHQGQEIKFCCKPCIAKFQADPVRYLEKL